MAAKRSAVPRVLSVPNYDVPPLKMIFHEIRYEKYQQFQKKENYFVTEELAAYWGLHFEEKPSGIDIYFDAHPCRCGHPSRENYNQRLFRLAPKQTASLHINGRFLSYEEAWYEQHYVNIAHLCKPNSLVFISKKFDFHSNQLVDLL